MGKDNVLNIAIVINVISSYREGFYDRLLSRSDMRVDIYCQDRIPGLNINTIHGKYTNNVHELKYLSANQEKLVWQFIPWKKIFSKYDVVFVEGNPRNLSHAILASVLRLFRKKVVLWTMAHSYRANSTTELIRLFWSRIFYYLFVYNDVEVDYLRSKGFTYNYIVGMNNGLDQKYIDATIYKWPEPRLQEWRNARNLNDRILLLSCARLDPKNGFDQIICALPSIIEQFPNIMWCVIGSGLEKSKLESMVNNAGLANHVIFIGEIYDENELAPWFLSSEIYVHPAAVGLGIIHAFSYGLPVVTHGNPERHGPEYAAFEQELTGRNFQEDDIQDLSCTVIKMLHDKEARTRMKKYAQYIARNKYNVDVMVERFVQISKAASCT